MCYFLVEYVVNFYTSKKGGISNIEFCFTDECISQGIKLRRKDAMGQ